MRLIDQPKWRLAAWLLLALMLAACAPAAQPAAQAVPTQQTAPTQAVASQAQSQPLATVAAAEATVAAAETTVVAAESTVAAAEPPAALPAQPVIATDFTPSDPATVSLAAGQPQLVEFFAFW